MKNKYSKGMVIEIPDESEYIVIATYTMNKEQYVLATPHVSRDDDNIIVDIMESILFKTDGNKDNVKLVTDETEIDEIIDYMLKNDN